MLSDFRQVEQNFRALDKDIREKIIKSNVSKGKLLDDIFAQQDYVWTTDQGKSFRAFWEFLMSQQKQEELDSLIKILMDLPQIQKLKEETIIHRIKNNLIEAGDKVNRTNDNLIEQLRKFVEQKSLLETKRILYSIEEIEKLLIENKQEKLFHNFTFHIDDIFKGHFFMGRSPFSPPTKIVFEASAPEIGNIDYTDQALFDQFSIDQNQLRENIKGLLKHQSQVSLREVIVSFPITKGVAEVVAYFHIASKESKNFINTELEEELLISNTKSNKLFHIKLPHIYFNR